MKNTPQAGSLGSLSAGRETENQPLRVALTRSPVIRVETSEGLPYWLVAGREQKRALAVQGAPPGRVWTLRELESLPWDERALTLGACLTAFQSPAPPERVSDTVRGNF